MILVCPCGWTGVPVYTGGEFVKPIGPLVATPTGSGAQRPGVKVGSLPSSTCPACRR